MISQNIIDWKNGLYIENRNVADNPMLKKEGEKGRRHSVLTSCNVLAGVKCSMQSWKRKLVENNEEKSKSE